MEIFPLFWGARPIFTAGNSDGDFQMLEWTTTGSGPRFAMIVHQAWGSICQIRSDDSRSKVSSILLTSSAKRFISMRHSA